MEGERFAFTRHPFFLPLTSSTNGESVLECVPGRVVPRHVHSTVSSLMTTWLTWWILTYPSGQVDPSGEHGAHLTPTAWALSVFFTDTIVRTTRSSQKLALRTLCDPLPHAQPDRDYQSIESASGELGPGKRIKALGLCTSPESVLLSNQH